jgi:N-acetylglutamate synthase
MTGDDVTPQALEEILLLCTVPREQLAYDGWLVRRARNDVKRARSVNAVYGSTRPLAEKIEHVEKLFAAYDLPPVWRLTHFSRPPGLDDALAERGYEVFDRSLMQVNRLTRPLPSPPDGLRFESMILERWSQEAGWLRGLTEEQIEAEFARLHEGEVPGYCTIAYAGREAVGCGLVMHEQEFAGLFDIFTVEHQRRRGIGTAVCAQLLGTARRMGATRGQLPGARGVHEARLRNAVRVLVPDQARGLRAAGDEPGLSGRLPRRVGVYSTAKAGSASDLP